jgi:hypothetical protein
MQLELEATHDVPPLGALQDAALRLTLQTVLPLLLERQQVTAPGLPQVDLAAALRSSFLHALDAVLAFTASFMVRTAQLT